MNSQSVFASPSYRRLESVSTMCNIGRDKCSLPPQKAKYALTGNRANAFVNSIIANGGKNRHNGLCRYIDGDALEVSLRLLELPLGGWALRETIQMVNGLERYHHVMVFHSEADATEALWNREDELRYMYQIL